ncbi:MAG: molybdopterin-dependent oxidoreductase [Dehalococcoidales bacterium]|nr:molybdopterin-dependent oxidoreductase [Dehalococcoidales bacterium]
MQKNVNLTINGIQRQVFVQTDMVLLDLLRDELNLTGTKHSCDRKGQCGACTVIVNGKAVRSCLKKVVDLEGADVITIEGLGTPENPHLIQEAFILAGAIQCGYCTPGMIMATKGLLEQNPDPDDSAIKKALAQNYCRCTGYKKIIDAVKLAARFLRKETTPEEYRRKINNKAIGVSHPRPWSMLKACGLAKFSGDIKMDNMAELAVVHSTAYHARIKSIDTSLAAKMTGVIGIMKADDIKGTNRIRLIEGDQPVLCEERVRVLGDPIIAIAAETREQARAAAKAVKIEYDPLPVIMEPEEALAPGALQLHSHSPNLCFSQPVIKGQAEQALKESANVVEADFSTQIVHQAPLEREACFAYIEGKDEQAQLVVIGRSIMIHEHASEIAEAVGVEKVRYKEAYSGGQFGIKVSITSEAVTAAAALHFKRPIRYVPSMEESIFITPKRHPFRMKVKLGSDTNGHITAYFNDFVINKGAYTMTGPVILNRAVHMLSGSYNIPNIKALGRTVFTNNAFGGAARGAGPPQVMFALESAVDMLAEKSGIDPLRFRRINSLKTGQTKATGMVVQEWSFEKLCDAIEPPYEKAKKEAADFNAKTGQIKRGVGLGANSFGIGESGESATVRLEIDPDGGVTVYGAIADPGEGNDSMLTQIAAHFLEIPLEKIRLYTRDTYKTVDSGASAASRMTYMAGNALIKAIEKMNTAMRDAGVKNFSDLYKAGNPTGFEGNYKVPGEFKLDEKTGQGDSFVSECHNIQMVEVEVSTETGEVKILKITSVVDAGKIINPQNLEGQIEGGMDQGVGYALREEYILGKTRDYLSIKFPTIKDTFDTEIITVETPRLNGPLGATGIGEMTMVSTAPAVVNAINNACGVRVFNLPATPEKVKAGLTKLKA